MKRLRLGVLASGTGTNFEAIVRAIDEDRLDAEIAVLVCNRPQARVVELASAAGIATRIIDHKRFDRREDFDAQVADALSEVGVELVVMAGFDRLVTGVLLERFSSRIINIHPALLPAFKGVDAQAQAARYGVTIAGATVHVVDDQVDHGPIIVQAAVPVVPGEDHDSVRRRILAQEHRIYPYAIQLFAEGRVRIEGRTVVVDGRAPAGDQCLISPPLPADGKTETER